MMIADLPQHERPREKLLNAGPSALTDAELLAIFLRTGTRGRSAIDLARTLLNEFGDIPKLLGATLQDFSKIPGLGAAKYVQFQAAVELIQRHITTKMQFDTTIVDVEHAQNYLALKLANKLSETFAALFLDSRNHVITYQELFHGTINHATIHLREIVRQAIKHNASALIVAHNHPSGIAIPSDADIKITQSIKKILELIDVRVLDHIIIGKGEAYSFSEHGEI